MTYPALDRKDGPCARARAAAEVLAKADARCRNASEVEKQAAFLAYREAFGVYCEAQTACREERIRTRQ